MTRACPACGERELPEHSRFCLACGAGLETVDASYTPAHLERDVLTTRSAHDGERKEVTILFADVAGSLAMAEALDPEEIHAIMDGLFHLALDAVHAQRGTINQFRGDGLMALFGAPLTWGEDAARALRAALALREASVAYSAELEARIGIPLVLRLGLHTGTVWVGSVGSDLRRDYTAEGPTVGLAARLEEAAQPGQILLSAETARRAGKLFEFRNVGLREVRGLSKPVHVLELVGPGRYRDRFEIERAQGLTPFVGRDAELAWLDRATLGACSGWVEIAGEAGIGKSRLAHEFLSSRGSGHVLEAPSREESAARAYVPWLELLRRWPDSLGERDTATRLAREYGGELEPRDGSPSAFASRLCALFEALKRDEPVLVLLEDLHWMDASSREVLETLARRAQGSRRQRLVLLATTRGTASEADRLDLQPLSASAARTLARSVLGQIEDTAPLAELAVERGGGNPLFVEEVSRTLRDGGAALRESARLEVEWRNRHEPVPETLNGVVAARIDALPDPAKRLLQAASVIGRPFDPDLLMQLEPGEARTLPVLLDQLVERALLRSGPDELLEFRHGLVRDVGYAQLLTERRRELHRRCAETFEARGAASTPEGASFVGGHFERGGAPARALEHLDRSGKAYLRLGAMTEAAHHLQRVWRILQRRTGGDRSGLISTGIALASALNGLDRSTDAAEVLDVLQTVELEPTERGRVAAVCIEGGWVRVSEGGDIAGGRRLIEHGLSLIEGDARARRLAMGAYSHLIRLFTLDGDTRRAIRSAERLLELAGPEDAFFAALALGSKGSALSDSGDAKAAVAACQDAVAHALRSDNEVAASMALALLTQAQVQAGRPEDALESARRGIDAGRRSDQLGAVYNATTWRGEALLLLGDVDAAVREFESLVEINPRWPGTPLRLARGCMALGRFAEAVGFARECLERGRGRVIRARALCALGSALGSQPEPSAEAERSLHESIAILDPLQLRPHLAEARAALAGFCSRHGDPEQATEQARRARELYLACGAELQASRVAV